MIIIKFLNTIELTMGKKIEAMDVFEVNSVDTALIRITVKSVISFRVDINFFKDSPM
jgi:hypothetical protein